MSRYQDIQARLVVAVDADMAEALDYRPMASGRADVGRASRVITAPLRVGSADGDKRVPGGNWSTRMDAGSAQIHISITAYPDVVTRKGDRIRAIERPGMPWFEVNGVNDRIYGRIILDLVEV